MIPDLLESMPVSAHGAVALVLLAGAVVWIFGRRLFRPMLVLAAAVFGAGVGFVAGAAIPHEWSILWPVGLGAVIAMLGAIVAYRFVMAMLLALSLGLAAPLGFFAYAELTGMYEGEPASEISDEQLVPEQLRDIPRDIVEDLNDRSKRLLERDDEREQGEDEQEPQPQWREQLDATVAFILKTAAQNWQDAAGKQKLVTILVAAGGVIGGILLGVLWPTAAASIVTSLAGSLIMLSSGYWLLMRSGLSVDGLLPGSSAGVLAWWLAAAIIGLVIQSSLGGKKADKD